MGRGVDAPTGHLTTDRGKITMATTRICSIEGCGKKSFGHGWCNLHYRRWRQHGDPLGGGTFNGAPAAFLRQAADYLGSDCLTWPFFVSGKGYAWIFYEGRSRSATRLVCALVHGPAPSSIHEAAHSCGNGHLGCISGKHLRWATPKENMADKTIHGTQLHGELIPSSKLKETEVRAIIVALNRGERSVDLAQQYKVASNTISGIRTGDRWNRVWETLISDKLRTRARRLKARITS